MKDRWHLCSTGLPSFSFCLGVVVLEQLIDLYGDEAQSFTLGCLVEETDLLDQKTHGPHQPKDLQKVRNSQR